MSVVFVAGVVIGAGAVSFILVADSLSGRRRAPWFALALGAVATLALLS